MRERGIEDKRREIEQILSLAKQRDGSGLVLEIERLEKKVEDLENELVITRNGLLTIDPSVTPIFLSKSKPSQDS